MNAEHEAVTWAARTVAGNLRVDHATADVLRAFQAACVRSLLLKGASIVRWLYDDDEARPYIDCDLLVHPSDAAIAERVLAGMDYVPPLDESQMPAWWREHAVPWLRDEGGGVVDLHRTLPGVRADARALWSVLSREAQPLLVAGFAAPALSIPGRALHLALHAAQHGPRWGRVLHDLDRALEQLDDATWHAAAGLAAELDATEAFTAGLLLRPAGRALADRLGTPQQVSVDVALRAAGARPEALTVDRIARASGARERIAIIRHKVIPPVTFMRYSNRLARRGRLGLAAAYVSRAVSVTARAAPAILTWRRVRGDRRRQADHHG